MAGAHNFKAFDELIEEIIDDDLDIGDYDDSQVAESIDWTSACAHVRDCEPYFSDNEE